MVEKILVATDGSDHAEKAVALASLIAASTDAAIHIVHVTLDGAPSEELQRMAEVEDIVSDVQKAEPQLNNVPGSVVEMIKWARRNAMNEKIMAAIAERVIDSASAAAKKAGAKKVETETLSGNPATAIVDAAKRAGCDMIVMGSRGLGDLKGLMVGSVSHKVANMAACTCVTVK